MIEAHSAIEGLMANSNAMSVTHYKINRVQQRLIQQMKPDITPPICDKLQAMLDMSSSEHNARNTKRTNL